MTRKRKPIHWTLGLVAVVVGALLVYLSVSDLERVPGSYICIFCVEWRWSLNSASLWRRRGAERRTGNAEFARKAEEVDAAVASTPPSRAEYTNV
jgi:hypothetical protein